LTDIFRMEKSFRPLRMLGACAALLAGLFVLAAGVEILLEQYSDLVKYGTHTTAYGWRILAGVVVRALIATAFFWLFARLGGSKPLPQLSRSN
jgi:divalent metal cation (Fe/Co/Zn/Cd) transporter